MRSENSPAPREERREQSEKREEGRGTGAREKKAGTIHNISEVEWMTRVIEQRVGEVSSSERRKKNKREQRDGSVPEGRGGGEKCRPLGQRKEERQEKRDERYKHNQNERAEEGTSSAPEW